ncbi:VaFE repeat-containing surface-anchored protein, partial [Corynebacterium sp. Marseille-P3884]|uniref:VaFE repeat-containing surface-anchored protein n=1 Tax=Corynebacterium sp. Marseille-P3884 TaxID=2495409 RepID=UPI001B32512C
MIAVIALVLALFKVPASASAENVNFEPMYDDPGGYEKKTGMTTERPEIVWAGGDTYEADDAFAEFSDVGWAWCIDRHAKNPIMNDDNVYSRQNAEVMTFEDENLRNAAIKIATLVEQAYKAGDYKLAARYSIYQAALLGDTATYRLNALRDIYTSSVADGVVADNLGATPAEFEELTGYTKDGDNDLKFVRPIEKAPEDAYIVFVQGRKDSVDGERIDPGDYQRVVPIDQPGLNPDPTPTPEPSDETSTTDEPAPSDETSTTDEPTTSGETSTTDEPTTSGETSTTDEPAPSDETTPAEPTPPAVVTTTREQDLNPSIATNAKFEDGSTEVVAGSTVIDTVDYKGLVPGKEYTLSAKLMERVGDKAPYQAGKVLGEGTATFTPEKSAGSVEVEITVN